MKDKMMKVAVSGMVLLVGSIVILTLHGTATSMAIAEHFRWFAFAFILVYGFKSFSLNVTAPNVLIQGNAEAGFKVVAGEGANNELRNLFVQKGGK